MKRILFISIFILIGCASNGQNDVNSWILKSLSFINTVTDIPYKSYVANSVQSQSVGFPTALLPIDNTYAWTDLGLTQVDDSYKETGEEWLESTIRRRYKTNGSFMLFNVEIGAFDFARELLVTITSGGDYIDSISVGAYLDATGSTDDFYLPMKWEITEDLQVVVYQLKPTSERPIMGNTPIEDDIEAQRIDKVYQIDDSGKFNLISTKYYKPQMYNKSNFLERAYDISTGGETLQ